jgi:hypothetical protein
LADSKDVRGIGRRGNERRENERKGIGERAKYK